MQSVADEACNQWLMRHAIRGIWYPTDLMGSKESQSGGNQGALRVHSADLMGSNESQS